MIAHPLLIVGAGPVGTLLAIYMAKRGYSVSVYEKRPDPRTSANFAGRSINLALSHRGIHALEKVGIANSILKNALPMKGRMIHDTKGTTNFQPYGEEGQYINSVSRFELSKNLIEIAEKEFNISFHFNEKCVSIDYDKQVAVFENYTTKNIAEVSYSLLAGADGAFSAVRKAMESTHESQTQIDKLQHGYKEFTILPNKNGEHRMSSSALHIWPREQFMLIALPNYDGSFTCTLFLAFEGEVSFASLSNEKKVNDFFDTYFSDAKELIGNATEQFLESEVSSLFTVHTFPWIYKNTFLIGDAAHAIVPFYGQGMNAGFEDVRLVNNLLDIYNNEWENVLPEFQSSRKPDADAIAELAMQNFIEMRDLVNDPEFVQKKKLEAQLHKENKNYLSLYSMVTFSDIPYSEALRKGKENDLLLNKLLNPQNQSF